MEKTFRRWFPTEKLTEVLENNPWFGDLLTLWHPSGTSGGLKASSSDYHLRLAVRDGYLNFYRAGRSLALVRFGSDGELKAKIHNKFIFGEKGRGQSYVSLTSKSLLASEHGPSCPYGGMKMLRSWIHNAYAPHQNEKLFVDSVIAQNANIIDVEMALPHFLANAAKQKHANPGKKQSPTAPRMDLVALEHRDDGWQFGADVPSLCDKPRLLIDARKPDTAFVSHHHLEKLREWPDIRV
jgi:hypothetical protein